MFVVLLAVCIQFTKRLTNVFCYNGTKINLFLEVGKGFPIKNEFLRCVNALKKPLIHPKGNVAARRVTAVEGICNEGSVNVSVEVSRLTDSN